MVLREEAGWRLMREIQEGFWNREVFANLKPRFPGSVVMRCIAATRGPLGGRDVLFAVAGPPLFGHALRGQGSTCHPGVTVWEEPGGADVVGLSS